MRKTIIALLLPMLLITISCETAPGPDNAASEAQSEMWRVEIVSYEVTDSLQTTVAAVQYGGGVVTTENLIEPARGNSFLLLKLSIEKIGAGRAVFSWNDAHISDGSGSVYLRHQNDTFLANLNIPRISSTDIVFGQEHGYVCFEIPSNADNLRFIADEGSISIALHVK